jgi:hypothetical protein
MKEKPVLEIKYSLDIDKNRVRSTYNKIQWYNKNGYKVLFPGDKKAEDIISEPLDKLLDLVEKEYDEQWYSQIDRDIQNEWTKAMNVWDGDVVKHTTLNILPRYYIELTKYGVGGSYRGDDTLIVNTSSMDATLIAGTIFHEIIHLIIEPLIKKYNVKHWYKEKIVDLTFKKIFPEYSFEQKLPEETNQIDLIFENNFGDMEEIIKRAGAIL